MRCVLACCLAWLACAPAGAADLVLYNGRLWTGDPDLPQASAIAIGGGRILAVGSDSQVLARAGQARRIDLGGRRVVPGINDAHVHLGAWWESTFLELASPDPGLAELEAAIRAAPGPADGWISASIGPTAFNDPALDQARLDAWQPRRPLILQAFTGHGTVVNSAARQRLGIDPSAPVPGGWYGTGADGAFDGRLYEYAQWRMRLSQPPLPDAVEIADLQGYSQQLLRWGTTSIQAMAALPAERMLALWQRSGAPQRLRLVRTPLPARWGEPVDGASLHAPAGSRVQVSGTKWILDGTPIEGGAATRAPYPGSGGHGRLNFEPEQVRELLAEVIARDDQPLLHVIGDHTTEVVLQAMAALAPAADWRQRRLRLEHGDGLRGDLLRQAREYGVVVVQNPSHFTLPHPYISGSLVAGLLDAGIPLALGSDGPPNPWLNLMWAVRPLAAPAQALGREQALRAYTAGSAWAEFAEQDKGRLAPGLVADLAVLSQDVLDEALPLEALPATTSLLTVIDGQIAWQDPGLEPATAAASAPGPRPAARSP